MIIDAGENPMLEPSDKLFRTAAEITSMSLSQDTGTLKGRSARLLMVTADMQCSEIEMEKGVCEDVHTHHGHSAIGCLLSDRLRLVIGAETFDAAPGDVWMHPQGMPHRVEALEDSSYLEVKSPALPS